MVGSPTNLKKMSKMSRSMWIISPGIGMNNHTTSLKTPWGSQCDLIPHFNPPCQPKMLMWEHVVRHAPESMNHHESSRNPTYSTHTIPRNDQGIPRILKKTYKSNLGVDFAETFSKLLVSTQLKHTRKSNWIIPPRIRVKIKHISETTTYLLMLQKSQGQPPFGWDGFWNPVVNHGMSTTFPSLNWFSRSDYYNGQKS